MRLDSTLRAALAACVTVSVAAAQNDECSGALVLSIGAPQAFDTSSASLSTPLWPCLTSTAPDLWFRVTSPGVGSLVVETCGSSYDTALEAFSGTCAALTSVACNDDFCALQSRVNIPATAGAVYYVRVGGYQALSGPGTIVATFVPVAGGNDECAGATSLALNSLVNFDTSSATVSAPPWPCGLGGGPDIWYRYTATSNGQLRAQTCGSLYDTALQILSGSCGALISVECNDDVCGVHSQVTWNATSGTIYYVRVGGWNNHSGSGTLLLEAPLAPALTIVSNLPGTWIDISATGTPLSLLDDGEVDVVTTIGNTVFPAGVARIGSNGGVRVTGVALNLGFTNAAIPSANAFAGEQTLLGFWDDFNTASGTVGEIYFQETQGRIVVQWEAAGFYNAPGETATFQIQIAATGGTFAQLLYQDVAGVRAANGGSATIGYQSGGVQNDVQWSFDTAGAIGNGTVLSLVPLGSIGVGTNYCTANPNSTGQTGLIAGTGSAVVASNDLTLVASRLPNNAFGYFITSATQASIPNPGGSQGVLCVGGAIGRYTGPGQIKNTGATGSFSLMLDLSQVPTPTGFVAAAAGETRSFQSWHRDSLGGVATSNFTNGLAVIFQ